MKETLHQHAAKVGTVGTVATFTLDQWSTAAGLLAGVLTCICLVPVAWSRWRALLRGKDVDAK